MPSFFLRLRLRGAPLLLVDCAGVCAFFKGGGVLKYGFVHPFRTTLALQGGGGGQGFDGFGLNIFHWMWETPFPSCTTSSKLTHGHSARKRHEPPRFWKPIDTNCKTRWRWPQTIWVDYARFVNTLNYSHLKTDWSSTQNKIWVDCSIAKM